MIYIKDLVKTYGIGEYAVHALRGCNISFREKQFTAIVGTSGSGKSTLLHLLGGLDIPTGGEVFYNDLSILKLEDSKLSTFRRQNIGFVFQFFELVPELTAKENILLPLLLDHAEEDQAYFVQLAERLSISERLFHYPSQLSGGQQQRVAIARALINKPKVLLCDEPTGNLDEKSGKEVIGLLKCLQTEYGQTVIMVTHDMNIAHFADTIVRIEDGRIIKQ